MEELRYGRPRAITTRANGGTDGGRRDGRGAEGPARTTRRGRARASWRKSCWRTRSSTPPSRGPLLPVSGQFVPRKRPWAHSTSHPLRTSSGSRAGFGPSRSGSRASRTASTASTAGIEEVGAVGADRPRRASPRSRRSSPSCPPTWRTSSSGLDAAPAHVPREQERLQVEELPPRRVGARGGRRRRRTAGGGIGGGTRAHVGARHGPSRVAWPGASSRARHVGGDRRERDAPERRFRRLHLGVPEPPRARARDREHDRGRGAVAGGGGEDGGRREVGREARRRPASARRARDRGRRPTRPAPADPSAGGERRREVGVGRTRGPAPSARLVPSVRQGRLAGDERAERRRRPARPPCRRARAGVRRARRAPPLRPRGARAAEPRALDRQEGAVRAPGRSIPTGRGGD